MKAAHCVFFLEVLLTFAQQKGHGNFQPLPFVKVVGVADPPATAAANEGSSIEI
jgi:hypothetical protein